MYPSFLPNIRVVNIEGFTVHPTFDRIVASHSEKSFFRTTIPITNTSINQICASLDICQTFSLCSQQLMSLRFISANIELVRSWLNYVSQSLVNHRLLWQMSSALSTTVCHFHGYWNLSLLMQLYHQLPIRCALHVSRIGHISIGFLAVTQHWMMDNCNCQV